MKVHVIAQHTGRVTSVELIGKSGSVWLDLALQALFRDARIPPLSTPGNEPIEFNFTMHYNLRLPTPRSGHGVYTWPNGDRYEGEFRDGKRTGHGVYTWPNGDRYEGEFHDGKLAGHGVYTRADGSRREGIWHDGNFIEPEAANFPTKEQAEAARATAEATQLPAARQPLREPLLGMPANRVCTYGNEIYSIGSVLNGRECKPDPDDPNGYQSGHEPPPIWVLLKKN